MANRHEELVDNGIGTGEFAVLDGDDECTDVVPNVRLSRIGKVGHLIPRLNVRAIFCFNKRSVTSLCRALDLDLNIVSFEITFWVSLSEIF